MNLWCVLFTYSCLGCIAHDDQLHILNCIAGFSGASRVFKTGSSDVIIYEDGFPGFSPIKADLVLMEKNALGDDRHLLWRNILCCFEVKFDATAGPIRTESSANQSQRVKSSVAQAADYARVHMSCRPFQLFSIGCLIFSSFFTVSVYDRGGVMHSRRMKVFDEDGVTNDFIIVILQLAQHLTEQDLGRDPTVTIEAGYSADSLTPPMYNVGLAPPSSSSGSQSTRWNTAGHPIWTSYSLLGRGTTVWKVHGSTGQHSPYILKTAWRHSKRTTESTVYQFLKEHNMAGRPGIAVFVSGQDVVGSGSAGDETVSVNSLRSAGA